MVTILKRLLTLVSILLLSITSVPAYANNDANTSKWRVNIPSWIDELAENISDRIDAVVGQSSRDKEVTCVALAVYYESRGESVAGQEAVAAVVMNRVNSSRFPDTACKVVFQRSQFSFVGPRLQPRSSPAWDRAIAIGNAFVDKEVTHIPYLFFNSVRRGGFRIGNHSFY